ILIVGANPRREAAVLNARIRKAWRLSGLPIGTIGEPAERTYPASDLGRDVAALAGLVRGEGSFGEILRTARRPLILVGESALSGPAGADVLQLAASFFARDNVEPGWNGLAVLHNAAARVGAMDIGFLPERDGLDTAGMLEAA